MGALEDIEKELGSKGKAVGATAPRPMANPNLPELPSELPTSFDSPDLQPRLSTTPERQLEEFRVRTAAKQMGVDPHLAAAIAHQESGFNPSAVSPTGVKGTMQLTHGTGKELGYSPDDPTQNIYGGVALLKKGQDMHPDDPAKAISIYPDPKDIPHYVPAVISAMNKSKGMEDSTPSLSDTIANEVKATPVKPPPVAPTEVAPANEDPTMGAVAMDMLGAVPNIAKNMAISGAKQAADVTGLSYLGRKVASSPKAQAVSQIVHRLLGDKRPFAEQAGAAQETIKQAQEGPGGSGGQVIGTAAGFAPTSAPNLAMKATELIPGVAKVAEVLKKAPGAVQAIAKTLGIAGKSAVGAGMTEAVANPQATPQSVMSQAGSGAKFGAALGALGFAGKKAASMLSDFSTGEPGMVDHLAKLGPAASKESLLAKNSKFLDEQENKLQEVLNGKAPMKATATAGEMVDPNNIPLSERTIDMRSLVRSKKIIEPLKSLANATETVSAKRFAQKLQTLANRGNVTLAEANQLKRDIAKQVYASGKEGNSRAAQFYQSVRNELQGAIEKEGGPAISEINQSMQPAMKLKAALEKPPGIGKQIRNSTEAVAAISGLLSGHLAIPAAIATERAATSIPGVTTAATVGSKMAGKGATTGALSPELMSILMKSLGLTN